MRTDDRTVLHPAVYFSERPPPRPEFPRGMPRAGALAVLILFAASALLYQNNVRAERPPDFARGGPFATNDPAFRRIQLNASPTPIPGLGTLHSSAVLTAPTHRQFTRPSAAAAFPFPEFGTYVYQVDGWEEVTAFGRRDYPAEMQMTVHRPKPEESGAPALRPDEIDFDLKFSDEHEEREVVAYRPNGIVFTYEAGTITYGPGFTRSSEATYEPPMTQIGVPLRMGAKASGTSEARNPDDGTVTRIEDWTVEVLGQEMMNVLGRRKVVWVVRVERQSRPGTPEQARRQRTYWFDPDRRIWVKWTETSEASQDFGPGAFAYETQFTATLLRVQPLP